MCVFRLFFHVDDGLKPYLDVSFSFTRIPAFPPPCATPTPVLTKDNVRADKLFPHEPSIKSPQGLPAAWFVGSQSTFCILQYCLDRPRVTALQPCPMRVSVITPPSDVKPKTTPLLAMGR